MPPILRRMNAPMSPARIVLSTLTAATLVVAPLGAQVAVAHSVQPDAGQAGAQLPVGKPPAVGNQLDSAFLRLRQPGFDLRRFTRIMPPSPLPYGTIMQSMAVTGSTLVVAGVYSNSSNITLTVFEKGKRKGAMRLLRMGHAMSIAATRTKSGKLVVWVEADTDRADGQGRGRSLARVEFRSGARLASGRLPRFKPNPQSTNVSAAIDYETNSLAVRYKVGRGTYFDRFDLEQAREKGRYVKLNSTIAPLPCKDSFGVTQGWAVSGDYMYCLQGAQGQTAYVSWWNLVNLDRRVYRVAGANGKVEPEGLTVAPWAGRPRLIFGLVRGSDHAIDVRASL